MSEFLDDSHAHSRSQCRSGCSAAVRRNATSLLVLVAAGAVASAPASQGATPPDRLPTAKPGRVIPSAAGVVLGRTKKAELFARWGRPSYCSAPPSPACVWRVATPSGTYLGSDGVAVGLLNRSAIAHSLTFSSVGWKTSKLRGWTTPDGIKIGSSYQALRQAYPKMRWNLGETDNRDRSNWLVPRYELLGNDYSLRFLIDRSLSGLSSGHVIRIEVAWYGPPLQCTLAADPAPGPRGEAAGMRIHGTCSGATMSRYYQASQSGKVSPLHVEFRPLGDTAISSTASSACPGQSASYGDCTSGPTGWPVDVTLGFESSSAGVELIVEQPPTWIPLGVKELRFRFTR